MLTWSASHPAVFFLSPMYTRDVLSQRCGNVFMFDVNKSLKQKQHKEMILIMLRVCVNIFNIYMYKAEQLSVCLCLWQEIPDLSTFVFLRRLCNKSDNSNERTRRI